MAFEGRTPGPQISSLDLLYPTELRVRAIESLQWRGDPLSVLISVTSDFV